MSRTFLLINTLTATELHDCLFVYANKYYSFLFFQATDLHENILKRKVLACDDVEPFCA